MSALKTTIDKDGPSRCCRADCDNPDKPTERYGVTVLLYSHDHTINVAIQIHMGIQVCKDCQPKVKSEELILDREAFQTFFRAATCLSDLPITHPGRICDFSRTKIAFREMGRYGGAR